MAKLVNANLSQNKIRLTYELNAVSESGARGRALGLTLQKFPVRVIKFNTRDVRVVEENVPVRPFNKYSVTVEAGDPSDVLEVPFEKFIDIVNALLGTEL